jgi:hypothetical protein
LKKEHDDQVGKETYDCGAVELVQAMESRPREMAKTLGQTKVGGNTRRRLWAEAKWERVGEMSWTIREMREEGGGVRHSGREARV